MIFFYSMQLMMLQSLIIIIFFVFDHLLMIIYFLIISLSMIIITSDLINLFFFYQSIFEVMNTIISLSLITITWMLFTLISIIMLSQPFIMIAQRQLIAVLIIVFDLIILLYPSHISLLFIEFILLNENSLISLLINHQ